MPPPMIATSHRVSVESGSYLRGGPCSKRHTGWPDLRSMKSAPPSLLRRLRERRLGWAGEDFAGGFKARAVARAVPGFLRAVPAHDAAHVRADRRFERQLSIGIAVSRHFLAIELDDAPLLALHRSERVRRWPHQPVFNEIIRVILVLLQV